MTLRTHLVRLPTLAACLLLGFVLLAKAALKEFTFEVPDYKGQTIDQVRKAAVYPNGISVFTKINEPPTPDQTVLSQTPPPHTFLRSGTRQDLQLVWQQPPQSIISKFADAWAQAQPKTPQTAIVPPLLRADADLATSRLHDQKLRENFTPTNQGVVIAVSPPEGSVVPRNDRITLTMGAYVPHLATHTVDEAKQILESVGLQLAASSGTPGTIATSNPAEGTAVPLNSSVDVTLYPTKSISTKPTIETTTDTQTPRSDPPRTTKVVPDVTQKTEASANGLLTKYGFHAQSHGDTTGIVFSQNPAAHTQADPRQAVDLYFALPQVPVPNITGDLRSDAFTILQRAGPRPDVVDGLSSYPFTQKRVIDQTPSPGTLVDAKSTVQIVLQASITPKGILLLIVLGVTGLAFLLIVLRLVFPATPIPPKPPTPRPPPAHCTFRPLPGKPNLRLPTTSPAIRFSLTLRPNQDPPRYTITSQPSVTSVRKQA